MDAKTRLAQLARQVEQIIYDGDLDFLLDEIPKIIMRRTRLGKDLSGNKLKPLSTGYIKERKRLADQLSTLTTPKKSNLTASGQLLSSIQGNRQGTKIVFRFKDQRTKTAFGGSKITNSEVAGYVRKQGRPFFGLTKTEATALEKRVSNILKKAVRKLVKSA